MKITGAVEMKGIVGSDGRWVIARAAANQHSACSSAEVQ